MTEQWSPVVGYEGLYSVSTRGRVRSEARTVSLGGTRLGQTRALPEKLLKPGIDDGGYPIVSLWNGRGRSYRIHQLMLRAFKGEPPPGCESLHDNDIKTDNRIENLSWGTRSRNMCDMIRNGRRGPRSSMPSRGLDGRFRKGDGT